ESTDCGTPHGSPNQAGRRPGSVWHEIDVCGTPLVEPAASLAESVLVTFLWREQDSIDHVAVTGGPAGEPQRSWTLLRKLPGSEGWLHTSWVRTDARFCYLLAPGRGPVPSEDAFAIDPFNPRVFPRHSQRFSVVELPDAVPDPWDDPPPTVSE